MSFFACASKNSFRSLKYIGLDAGRIQHALDPGGGGGALPC